MDRLGARENAAEEQRRAAHGYRVLPIALANLMRENRASTVWSRIHTRQAISFGVGGLALEFLIIAVPLLMFVTFAPPIEAIITAYLVALAIACLVGLALVIMAFRCAGRAARGELFSIPIVGFFVDRWVGGEGREPRH